MNVPRKLACHRSSVSGRAACVWLLASFLPVTFAYGQPATPKERQAKSADVKTTTPEQDVQAALDDAIARLKSGDIVGFIEFYSPVDELREARKGRPGSSLRHVVTPAARAATLKRLERARSNDPQIQLGGFLATITIPEPPESAADAEPVVPVAEISQKPLAGYPGSLAEVLKLAIADLEGKRTDTFIDRLFPRGELGHPQAALRRKQLKSRLKQHPEMAQRMLDDLQTILRMPQVEKATGDVATIPIKGQLVPRARGQQIQLPGRTFRFEKVEGFWRFRDTSSKLIKSQAKIAAQGPASLSGFGAADVVIMERLGDRWRFLEF